MEPKNVSIKFLKDVLDDIKDGNDNALGNYLFKGYRIQVSKYKSSNTERYIMLYRRRRKMGLCIRCGIKITRKNPRTNKLFRLCDYHREITDKRK